MEDKQYEDDVDIEDNVKSDNSNEGDEDENERVRKKQRKKKMLIEHLVLDARHLRWQLMD